MWTHSCFPFCSCNNYCTSHSDRVNKSIRDLMQHWGRLIQYSIICNGGWGRAWGGRKSATSSKSSKRYVTIIWLYTCMFGLCVYTCMWVSEEMRNSAGGKRVVTGACGSARTSTPSELLIGAGWLMARSHKVYNLATVWASWIWKNRCVSPPPHEGQNLLPSWSATSTTAASAATWPRTNKSGSPLPRTPYLWAEELSLFVRLNGHWGLVLCLWQWLCSSSEQDARAPVEETGQNDLARGEASSHPMQ